jgi:hypothetical protein
MSSHMGQRQPSESGGAPGMTASNVQLGFVHLNMFIAHFS